MKRFILMKDLLSATVPSRLILVIGTFFTGFLLFQSKYNIDLALLIMAIISISLADLAASALNSCADRKTDLINKPDRILSKDPAKVKAVIKLSIILFMLSLVFGFFISYLFLIVIIFRGIFELIYSTFQLKNLFLINHILVGITYALIPLAASWTLYAKYSLVPFPNIFYLFILITILLTPLKDIEDYWGDKTNHTKTIIVFAGIKKSKIVVSLLIVSVFVSIILAPLEGLTKSGLKLTLIATILAITAYFSTIQINRIIKNKKPIKMFTPFATLIAVIINIIIILV